MRLRVEVLGPVAVRSPGTTISGAQLGSRKARVALAALAVEYPRRLTADQLVDRAWGDAAPERPTRNLATLISRLRSKLGVAAIDGDVHSGFRLGSSTTVDLYEAEAHITRLGAAGSGRSEPRVLDSAMAAISLLEAGPAGADVGDAQWLDEARRHQDVILRVARGRAWSAALAAGDVELACRLSAAAIADDPIDEEAVRAYMVAEARRGRRGAAIRQFESLRSHLEDELGVAPAPETEAVYAQLVSGQEAGPTPVRSAVAAADPYDLVLTCAAILDDPFVADDVADLASLDVIAVHRMLSALRADGTLVADGACFRFGEGHRRQTVIVEADAGLVTSLHRRAARCYEQVPGVAAAHLCAAGDRAGALGAWRRAAREAMAAFDPRRAAEHLTSALAVSSELGDPVVDAELLIERGLVAEHIGDYGEALADHRRAIELARSAGAVEVEARAQERMAWTMYFARNSPWRSDLRDAALPVCEQVVETPYARPSARILLGRLRHATGDVVGAERTFDDLDITDLGHDDRVSADLCMSLLRAHTDRYRDAFDRAERAAALGRRTGQYRHVLTGTFVSVVVALNRGRLAAALDRLEMLLALAHGFDDGMYQVRAATMGALVWHELGEPGRARELADIALSGVDGEGAGSTHTGLHARLADAEITMAVDPAGAMARLRQIEGDIDDTVAYRWRLELRCIELGSRLDTSRAEELVERAELFGAGKYAALGLHHLGRVEAAAARARPLDSDALTARIGTEGERRRARQAIARSLPVDQRRRYLAAM